MPSDSTDTPPPFRWSILGTGPVSRKFVLGLKALKGTAVATVAASRNREKAEAFAKALGIPHVSDYAGAAAHHEADALYIATPPALHEEHALAGIRAGKPVLIEKPFAMDPEAATRIMEAAHEAQVFAMEAMWTRFMPLIQEIKTRIEAGEIGAPRAFHGSFFGADMVDPGASLFDAARGGGALMHRGVYPLSLARYFLGPIAETEAMARIGETGVDEDCAVTLRHTSGAISTLRASLRAGGTNAASIHGEAGRIEIAAPLFRPFKARVFKTTPRKSGGGGGRLEALKEGRFAQGLNQRLSGLRGGGKQITKRYQGNGYHYEAEAVMTAVRSGALESPIMPLQESVEVMSAIAAAKASWKG